MTGLEWLTYDQFAPRVGQTFDVGGDEGPTVPMVLSDATERSEYGGRGPDGQQRRQFSLEFRGPATSALPQGTYRLTNAELGELTVFLVPIGADVESVRYEAAFA